MGYESLEKIIPHRGAGQWDARLAPDSASRVSGDAARQTAHCITGMAANDTVEPRLPAGSALIDDLTDEQCMESF